MTPLAAAEVGRPAAAAAAFRPVVDLGTAKNFAILAKAGITNTGGSRVTGALGVSPIASTAITGFGLMLDSSRRFSTSGQVVGRVFAANYAAPTPTMLTTAVGDMQTAYADAAGRRNPRAVELGNGNIGGRVLAPGLYKWSTNVTVPANVTLQGSENAVWIFQIAGNLTVAAGKAVQIVGGGQPKNVFWQVAGKTTLETTAVIRGNILSKTSIVFKTGARINGRALAQTAVTLDANSVTRPRF